ncbi:MAG: hypothetical protein ACRD20_08595 [Terriglobales bacterium]
MTDPAGKTPVPEGPEARQWIGRIIIAVILGEAIWNLIVSAVTNLVVPWLGDVMGPSSGLPTSFIQRPYDYPAFFVSLLESCIAALTAAILNYLFQRRRKLRTMSVKRSAAPVVSPPMVPAPVVPVPVVPPPVVPEPVIPQAAAPVMTQAKPPALPPAITQKPAPFTPSAPVEAAADASAGSVPRASIAGPVAVEAPVRPVAETLAPKSPPPAPKLAPAKPTKPKQVFYNIVGEPMPSDED